MKTKNNPVAQYVTLVGVIVAMFFVVSPAQAAAPKVPRKIDGVYDLKSKQDSVPIAVMIDNHTAARPQSGLQSASFVYESLAEGGIPRFMAVYANVSLSRVGPVRSIRPYFAKYASEWRAVVAHAGGSPDGLKEVKKQLLLSIEGIKGKYAKYFFRALGGGVHGLYTNTKNLVAAAKLGKVWGKKATYRAYQFKDDAATSARGKDKKGVTIDLGYGKLYDIKYVYDKKMNAYRRFTGGKVHKDRLTNRQINVKNVIILNVPKEKVLDRKGRLDLQTVGKGTGYLMQNGKNVKITWAKKSANARTIIKTLDGQEILLVRGNTWITVVPKGHSYKFI